MGVLVDPAILRQYAETVDTTADFIRRSTLPDRIEELCACLPGSRTAFMASGGVSEVERVIRMVAGCYESMADAVRNAAGEYEATDQGLSSALSKIPQKR